MRTVWGKTYVHLLHYSDGLQGVHICQNIISWNRPLLPSLSLTLKGLLRLLLLPLILAQPNFGEVPRHKRKRGVTAFQAKIFQAKKYGKPAYLCGITGVGGRGEIAKSQRAQCQLISPKLSYPCERYHSHHPDAGCHVVH